MIDSLDDARVHMEVIQRQVDEVIRILTAEQALRDGRRVTDAALMNAINQVGDKADAAYHEANSVNVKISNLNNRLIEQGDRADAEIRRTDDHQIVQDDRIDAVEEAS